MALWCDTVVLKVQIFHVISQLLLLFEAYKKWAIIIKELLNVLDGVYSMSVTFNVNYTF